MDQGIQPAEVKIKCLGLRRDAALPAISRNIILFKFDMNAIYVDLVRLSMKT